MIEPLFFLYLFSFIFKKVLKPKDTQDGDRDFLISTLTGLITLACIVIGFAFSIAISNLNQADSNLFREATRIVSLERLLLVEGSHQSLEAKKIWIPMRPQLFLTSGLKWSRVATAKKPLG